jgi:hypothetical protein
LGAEVASQPQWPDAHEAVGQHVQQKAPQEGLGLQGGQAADIAPGTVFPAKGHVTVTEQEQPIVGDGDGSWMT